MVIPMKYLSVCSGIEAISVAWKSLDMQPVGFAEIEPFCCKLLRERYPNVANYGDFTKIRKAEADILVGGTPCQSFSYCGQRLGLDDPRGNLSIHFVALARRIRPKWIIWENVPGVLQADEGRAFGTILGWLEDSGYGWAYRILDARWFGVPQRRRRVVLVGYLGAWQPPAAVLFDSPAAFQPTGPMREKRRDPAHLVKYVTDEVIYVNPRGLRNSKSSHQIGVKIDGIVDALCSDGPGAVIQRGQVPRKMSPVEWERCQGFPDNYTLVSFQGKSDPIGKRYKALANSMPVPMFRWLGTRLLAVDGCLGDLW